MAKDPLVPKGAARPIRAAGAKPTAADLTQLPLYIAASLAGMVTAMLVSRAAFFEALKARLGRRPKREPVVPNRARSLPMLAEAVLGSSKWMIASVLGPPRAAADAGMTAVHHELPKS